jgi:hypothetical protein
MCVALSPSVLNPTMESENTFSAVAISVADSGTAVPVAAERFSADAAAPSSTSATGTPALISSSIPCAA